MPKYKLKKDVKIGSLSAETDTLLSQVFVDVGHVGRLLDTGDGAFIILGRAGSGKTALIKRIKESASHISTLDPEDLSMQYLHNSSLRALLALNVNLEVFYKHLWRHVCILELIRMRFGDAGDVPTVIQQIFPLEKVFRREQQRTKETAQKYLQEFGDGYWIKSDTRIKKITSEFEDRIRHDDKLAAAIGLVPASLNAGQSNGTEHRRSERIEQEVIDRAQSIVSDFQIADLNRVVDLLAKHGFDDQKKQYYLVIDDLDKDWMPDDGIYLDLIKSLLFTVRELNARLSTVKIVVALREDIYHRVFQRASRHEPQREKWEDFLLRITWTKEELVQLIDTRLDAVFRGEFILAPPKLVDILPHRKKKDHEDPLDFLLSRTFMRPRDVIDFINRVMSNSVEFTRFSWATLYQTEVEYSEARLKSVFDEWKAAFYSLPVIYGLLKQLGPRFKPCDISEEQVFKILESPRAKDCVWLTNLMTKLVENELDASQVKLEFVKALYLVGLVGVRQEASHRDVYSFDRALSRIRDLRSDQQFVVHKMFWSALGLASSIAASAG